MYFKQSVLLLFVSILSFVAANAIEEYDVDVLRTMLRSHTLCPTLYQVYMQNCTQNYNSGIQRCEDQEANQKLLIKEASMAQHNQLIESAESSCKNLLDCNTEGNDFDKIFGCLSKKSALTSLAINNLRYEASAMQSSYNTGIQSAENVKNSCTNTTTQQFSDKTNKGMEKLNKCFIDGVWDLIEELLQPVTNPTEVPAITETSVFTEAPATTTEDFFPTVIVNDKSEDPESLDFKDIRS